MKILVTGGAGYIGSHTCVELITAGYEVVVLDNLSNSSVESLNRVESLLNCQIVFYQGDVCDTEILTKIFEEQSIKGVIHFAGYKAVSESVIKPIEYYNNNVTGAITLSSVMNKFGCKTCNGTGTSEIDPSELIRQNRIRLTRNLPKLVRV